MTDRAALVRSDAEARRAAREVFDLPLVLEAGAGTGKTTALVTRVLAWTLGPGWERAAAAQAQSPTEVLARRVLRGVVAITFTEAAAAEMGQRVAEALLAVEADALPAWLAGAPLPGETAERRRRAAALRGALDHLAVQTIHAWCRRLLVAHALEAGLHPKLEIDADQRLQAEVVREVLEAGLAQGYLATASDPAPLELAGAGFGPAELELELLALLAEGVTARVLRDDPLAADQVAALVARVQDAVAALCDAAQESLRSVSGNPTARALGELLDQTRQRLAEAAPRDAASLESFCHWVCESWEKKYLDRLRKWGREGFAPTEEAALGGRMTHVAEAAARLAPVLAHLRAIEPRRLELARRVLGGLLHEVEQRLRARGVATFSALLTESCDLLVARPQVAARVRRAIDQLLVDEFQDTDRRQCDILRAIALSGPEDERPGLFLVGDPKQSIYGWRSADLAAYHGFTELVKQCGGRVETLSVNFRSAPAILEEVERVIAPVMEERPGVQPRFERLVASEATAGKSGFQRGRFAPTEYWVSTGWDAETGEPRKTRAAEASALEAAALARELRELHDREGVAWQRIGVLFRGRSDLELYLAELRRSGVPYAVEGDRSYFRRREVIEAAALVRCVLDPNDHVALVALLRSSAVGVPDAALIPLWIRAFPTRFARLHRTSEEDVAELRRTLDEVAGALPQVPGLSRVKGWEGNLVTMVQLLARLRQSFASDPVDEFVEKLRATTLIETTEAGRYLGAWRVANLERFFRELAEQLCRGVSPQAALRQLRRSILDETQEEEAPPKDFANDAVQVMTIHGAKGLDFDHVYVMQLHKGPGRDPAAGVDPRVVGERLEYRLLGAPTLGFDLAARDDQTVAEAERVRTLYVALTRAKERLVIAGGWPESPTGSISGQAVELLQRREPSPPALGAAMAAAREAPDGRCVDLAGTRWVFLGLPAATPPPPPEAAESRDGVATPERAAADAAALREARHAAARRESRPWGSSATALAHEEGLAACAERRFGDAPPRRTRAGGAVGAGGAVRDGAAVARAVGTAVHRLLEGFEPDADPDAQVARWREQLPQLLREIAEPAACAAALVEARRLLDALAGGRLLAKLRELGDAVLYRELPVLLPATDDSEPVGYVSGIADLVYRDPRDGRLVVADYKTDRLDDPTRREGRLAAYARQGAVYQRALQEALGLDYLPAFELWLLRSDEIRPARSEDMP